MTLPRGSLTVFAVWLAWGAGFARVEASTAGAWGRDFEGQTTVPGAMTNPVAVAAGYYHSLALLRDGSVRTWGDTNSGQGTVPGSATNLVGVAAGAFHNLGLTSGGKVVGWGRNAEGQGTAPATLSNVVAVAAGDYFSMALTTDGEVVQWGAAPALTNLLNRVVGISAGAGHGLAVRDTGRVVGWGDDTQGQVSGSAAISNAVAVAAGGYHSIALLADGTVTAWGADWSGQATVPAGLTNVVAVAAGREFSVALREDGTAVGWGGDWFGQVGGAFSLTGGVMLAAGREHALVVTSTNAWPRLARVAAVFGKRGEAVSTNLVAVPAGAVVSASALPAGLSLDGTNGLLSGISMLGGTALAQLRATNDEALTVGVVRVGIYPFVSLIDAPSAATSNFTQNATNVVRVATYGTHTAAVRANGTVVEWGKMGTNATLPAQPAGLSNVVDVVTGADFTIALKRDGRLAQWGTGLGSTAYTLVTNAVWIRASANWVAVLLSQGTNWTWMVSGSGGEYINAAPGSGFVDVAMAQFDQWALRPDGTKASSSIYAPPTAVARALYGGPRTIFQVGPDGIVSGMDVYASGSSYGTNVTPANLPPQVAVAPGLQRVAVLSPQGNLQGWTTSYPFSPSPNSVLLLTNLTGGTRGDVAQVAASSNWFVTVSSDLPPLVITSPATSPGRVGFPMTYRITASSSSTNFEAQSLPPGLSVNATNGIISGTVTNAGDYFVRVTASQSDGIPASRVVRLQLTSGNPPTTLTFAGSNVLENAVAGTVLGTLSATDVDGGPLTYSLVSGTGSKNNGALSIVSNEVRVASSAGIDYETSNPLSFRIRVTDSGNNTLESAFTVPVINITSDDDDGDGLTEAQESVAGTSASKPDTDNDGASDGDEVTQGTSPLSALGTPRSYVVARGYSHGGSTTVPSNLTNGVAVSAGGYFGAVLRDNGTVRILGNEVGAVTSVPATATNLIQIAAGDRNMVGLKRDGTVVGWGEAGSYSLNSAPAGLSNVVAISACQEVVAALRADGTVAVWGNTKAITNAGIALASNVVAIAAGEAHVAGLLSDGSIRVWGTNQYGQTNVPVAVNGYSAVGSGEGFVIAIEPDGSVRKWGYDFGGYVQPPTALPLQTRVDGSDMAGIGISRDGRVSIWGWPFNAVTNMPAGQSNVTDVSVGGINAYALALTRRDAPELWIGEMRTLGLGQPCRVSLRANSVSSNWSMAFLPPGLVFDPATATISGTPASAGRFNAVVTATMQGEVVRRIVPFTVTPSLLADYWTWAHAALGDEAFNPAVSQPGVDPDQDGQANLVEYVFDGRPLQGDGTPFSVSRTTVGGKEYLTLTFDVVPDLVDAAWAVEVSGDLVTWQSGPGAVSQVSTTTSGGLEHVTMRDNTPVSDQARRFMRVRVARP